MDLNTSSNNKSTTNATTNLCQQVRQSCRDWYQQHTDLVRINGPACAHLAHENFSQQQQSTVQWDEEGWHYHPPDHWPEHVRCERIALYILAVDAINFCFWPLSGYEYQHLATSLTTAAQADHDLQARNLVAMVPEYAFTANNLRDMTVKHMQTLLGLGSGSSQQQLTHDLMLEQRCALWHQVGKVLSQEFQGSAMNLIQAAKGSAVQAVQLLFDHLEGFRDVTNISETSVYFLKRAQICVADWQAALALSWPDMDQLTTFSDYRLPQFLRQRGVLEYHDDLAESVDSYQELSAGSMLEVSIRAAVVVAVDELVKLLNKLQREQQQHDDSFSQKEYYTAVSVDWYLWQVGERLHAAGQLSPHHRVRTIYY